MAYLMYFNEGFD